MYHISCICSDSSNVSEDDPAGPPGLPPTGREGDGGPASGRADQDTNLFWTNEHLLPEQAVHCVLC